MTEETSRAKAKCSKCGRDIVPAMVENSFTGWRHFWTEEEYAGDRSEAWKQIEAAGCFNQPVPAEPKGDADDDALMDAGSLNPAGEVEPKV